MFKVHRQKKCSHTSLFYQLIANAQSDTDAAATLAELRHSEHSL